MEYVPLYSPADTSESAFIESLLKAGGIRYYIQGDIASTAQANFSLNQRTIYVHPADFKAAYTILKDFIGGNPDEIPDLGFEDERPEQKEAEPNKDPYDENYPYWFLFLLGGFIMYKLLGH